MVFDSSTALLTTSDDVSDDSIIWHARLGHIGQLSNVYLQTCEQSLAGKSIRKPFGKAKRAFFSLCN